MESYGNEFQRLRYKQDSNNTNQKKVLFSPKMTMILIRHIKVAYDWCFIDEYRRKKEKKKTFDLHIGALHK